MRKHLLMVAALSVAAPALAVAPASDVFLPSVGKGQGSCVGGVCSQWSTAVWILNPGAQLATVTISFLQRGADNSTPVMQTVNVPAGQTVSLPDVMANPFGIDGKFGAMRFVSDVPIVVTGRIADGNVQTNKGTGSAGQFFAGVSALASIGSGQSAETTGLAQDGGGLWRTNVGFVEVTGHSVTVLVERLSGNGAVLASKSYQTKPFEAKQFNLDDIGGSAGLNQRVRFTVSGGNGRIIPFGSRLDNLTGDPSTVEATGLAIDPLLAVGNWTGAWYNTTFGSTGAANATVSYVPASHTMQVMIDVDGNVFGGSNPPAESMSASLDGSGFTFASTSATFGQINVVVGLDGTINGTLSAIPAPGIDSLDVTGGYSKGIAMLLYTVNFTGSGTASGVIWLSKS